MVRTTEDIGTGAQRKGGKRKVEIEEVRRRKERKRIKLISQMISQQVGPTCSSLAYENQPWKALYIRAKQ